MKGTLLAAFFASSLPWAVLAQTPPSAEHSHQHPSGTAPAQVQPSHTPPQPQGAMQMGQQMMANMPEQCRAHMQTIPEGCRTMMHQMMQGGMMRGGTMMGGGKSAETASVAIKAYIAAMEKMHGPMMEGVQDADPDAAFVKGMIPHHQGAIDMAKVVLQHGKDEQAKKWASDVVREQQREIAEMQDWLNKRGK